MLERNYHSRYGEIDLIARDCDGTIVFIEVKGRANSHFGYGAEAVTSAKCQKIRRTAQQYIYEKGLHWDGNFRYDVIVIENRKMEHMVNAFY